jgi:hypothetical protein
MYETKGIAVLFQHLIVNIFAPSRRSDSVHVTVILVTAYRLPH